MGSSPVNCLLFSFSSFDLPFSWLPLPVKQSLKVSWAMNMNLFAGTYTVSFHPPGPSLTKRDSFNSMTLVFRVWRKCWSSSACWRSSNSIASCENDIPSSRITKVRSAHTICNEKSVYYLVTEAWGCFKVELNWLTNKTNLPTKQLISSADGIT